jgi:hypothetical protein
MSRGLTSQWALDRAQIIRREIMTTETTCAGLMAPWGARAGLPGFNSSPLSLSGLPRLTRSIHRRGDMRMRFRKRKLTVFWEPVPSSVGDGVALKLLRMLGPPKDRRERRQLDSPMLCGSRGALSHPVRAGDSEKVCFVSPRCCHKAKVNSSTELVEVLGPTGSFGRDALRRVLTPSGRYLLDHSM